MSTTLALAVTGASGLRTTYSAHSPNTWSPTSSAATSGVETALRGSLKAKPLGRRRNRDVGSDFKRADVGRRAQEGPCRVRRVEIRQEDPGVMGRAIRADLLVRVQEQRITLLTGGFVAGRRAECGD